MYLKERTYSLLHRPVRSFAGGGQRPLRRGQRGRHVLEGPAGDGRPRREVAWPREGAPQEILAQRSETRAAERSVRHREGHQQPHPAAGTRDARLLLRRFFVPFLRVLEFR